MRRLLARLALRRLATPLAWFLAVAALGALLWTLPPPASPPASPGPPEQPASAAPVPHQVTRSLAELGLHLAPQALSDFALLLNRVPQAGSELLALLLARLQTTNGFRLLQLGLPQQQQGRRLSATEQEELVAQVTDTLRREALPVAFHGAVFFTNFTIFDRQSPTFVGLVRDPLDRVLAGLYRTSVRRKRRLAPSRPIDEDLQDALDSCLAGKRRPGCAWAEPQTPYFCGHDSRCRFTGNDWALRQAKRNIEHYFPVVGVLEELNATLAVLDKRLPLFFAGAHNVYRLHLHESQVQWNKQKNFSLSPSLQRNIKKRLSLEYELYLWAKQRLMLQQIEDSLKRRVYDETDQDRMIHTVHKKAQPTAIDEKFSLD